MNPIKMNTQITLMMTKRIGMMFSLLAASATLHAQEGETGEEEVFELSPFEVSSEGNIGYLANNTLAGTRLNAQLRDVANAVQVVTAEFIDDVGATDFSELLIYTTSTEAYGVNGNASFGESQGSVGEELGQERARREPQLNTRVRGLARADLARDYFLSDIQFDPYIISEVTINRGPNASLFGLGSPGGIINSSIDKAQTDRTFGEINFKADEFGTWRASINYNQMVLEDRLAVRVAALDSNQRYEQEQAWYDEERYFVAGTFRPWKNAAIRANYEEGDAYGSKPISVPPIDGITPWLANGKPSYNPSTDEWFVNGELVTDPNYALELERASTFLFRTGLTRDGGPVAVFDDPTSPVMGNLGSYATMQVGLRGPATGRTDGTYPFNGDAALRKWQQAHRMFYRNPEYIVGGIQDFPVNSRFFYKTHMLEDRSIFDYRKNSILGPSPLHTQNFEVYSIRAEQTFLNNNLGIEVAYQDQYWKAFLAESKGIELTPDINLTLIDGSPNPNYGRPYAGNRGYAQGTIRDRQAFQAIGFAKYDFADRQDGWLRHFGNHTLTGVYQDQENTSMAPNLLYARTGASWAVHTAVGRIQAAEALAASEFVNVGLVRGHVMQYVGPSLAGINSLDEAVIQPVTARQIPYNTDNALVWNPFGGQWEQGPATWYTYHNEPNDVWGFGNDRNTEWIKSYSTVLQSQFLKGHLVTTVSWRRDSVEQATGTGPTDPATGLYLPVIPELDDPFLSETVKQTSFGIVGHVPDKWLPEGYGLSLHYVDSQNFAAGVSGVDIFNRPGPLQTGVTKEYGFSIEAFDRKLYLRFNLFETSQENDVITGALAQVGDDLRKVMENNSPQELAAAGWDLDTLFKPGFLEAIDFRPLNPDVPNNETFWLYTNIAGSPTNHYRDTITEGVEIEVSYAPTPNWRITFNIASAEVEVSNVMKISEPELTRIANEIFSDPEIGDLWIVSNRETADEDQGRLRSRADNLLSAIAIQTATEGGPLPEVAKWRFNAVTNYSFPKDHALGGFGIGTGIRYQDARYTGSAIQEIDGVWVPDYSKKYYGKDELDVDAWISYSTRIFKDMSLRLQVRVRNLNAGSGELMPVRSDPDGTHRIKIIGAPRYFEFSAQLKF